MSTTLSPKQCNVCHKSDSTPDRWLLTCVSCKRHWHHICHLPLITESELIQRVRASNNRSLRGTLDDWICRKCLNRRNKASPSSASQAFGVELEATQTQDRTANTTRSSSHSAKHTRPLERSGEVIDIDSDDDDDIQVVSMSGSALALRGSSSQHTIVDLTDDTMNDVTPGSTTRIVLQGPKSTRPTSQHRAEQLTGATPKHLASPPSDISVASTPTLEDSRETSRQPSILSTSTYRSQPASSTSREPSVATRMADLAVNSRSTSQAASEQTLMGDSPRPPTLGSRVPQRPSIPYLETSGSSSSASKVPDMRRLIGDLRAQGKFNLSPYEQEMRRLTGRGADTDGSVPGGTPSGVPPQPSHNAGGRTEDSDGDVDMGGDAGAESPRSQPSDLESMYGDLPPVRKVKKEEQDPVLLVPALPVQSSEDSRILIAYINRAEAAEEPDGWVRMLRNREERYAQRHAEGVRVPRKARDATMLAKPERLEQAFDVVNTRADPWVTARSGIRQWAVGIATLDRLFG